MSGDSCEPVRAERYHRSATAGGSEQQSVVSHFLTIFQPTRPCAGGALPTRRASRGRSPGKMSAGSLRRTRVLHRAYRIGRSFRPRPSGCLPHPRGAREAGEHGFGGGEHGEAVRVGASSYDTYGRLSATYDPLSNVTASFAYPLNASHVSTDQIASITTSDGVTMDFTYDGFLKTKTTWSSAAVTGSVTWTYDDFFRPSTLQVGSSSAITFAYDADSLYTGTSSPAFTVTRDVSGSSLDGLPYSSTLGNVSDAWTYDGFGAPSSYTVKTSDGTVLYTWSGEGGDGTPVTRDSLGRVTNMLETANGETHEWTYTYDSRGRLSSATEDGATTTYGYDANGNLTSVNGSTFGTYDAQDRLITLSPPSQNTWTYSYTNNGDLTSKSSTPQTLDFTYDVSSNLRAVDITGFGGASIDYVIDGMNRRIGKSITPATGSTVKDGLLYDEQRRVVAELSSSGSVLSTFVYGLKTNVPDYMVRGGTTYRILSDWRGSVRLVLNTTETGAATIVQQIDYDAWGNVTHLVDPSCTVGGTALCFQPFGFAGGVWEPSTGVVRFGARDYDPQAGRWTQKDPTRFDALETNFYAYAADEPINNIDPTGLQTQCPKDINACFGFCDDEYEAANAHCRKLKSPASRAICFGEAVLNYGICNAECRALFPGE
jgi:RHS repeat-associated protein